VSNVFHKNFTLDDNHAVTARLYADVAARDADTAFQVTANINKFVKVTSPDSYYILSSVGPAVWVEMSSTGFNEFTELTDTPSTYVSQGGKVVEVNAGETGLQFGQILTTLGTPSFSQLTVDDLRLDGQILSSLAGDIILNPAQSVEVLASELMLTNTAGTAAIVITAVGPDADPLIRFELVDGIPTFVMGVDDNDSDKFKIGTTSLETNTRLTIDSAGLFGFNLSNPTKAGHFMGISGSTAEVLISTDTNAIGETASLAFTIPNGTPRSGMRGTTRTGDTTDLVLFAQSGVSTEFDAITILGASGFVGIGDTTPENMLDVHNASAESAIAITSLGTDTDPLIKFELADNVATFSIGVDDSDADKFKIGTTALATNTRLTIDSIGRVGIGTVSPTSLLCVHSDTGGVAIAITSLGTDTDPIIKFELADNLSTFTIGVDDSDADKFKIGTTTLETNTRLTIDSAGNIGLGQSTPTDKLHVEGSIRISAGIAATLKIGSQDGTNEGGQIDWDGAGSNDDWTQDVFFQKMRFFTSSSSFNIVELNNAGSGTMNLTVEDMIGVGSLDNPLHNLDVRGTTGFELTESAVNINSGKQTFIGITDTAATRTVTLRTVDTVLRRIYIIKDQSGGAGTFNIDVVTEGAQTIDGQTNILIAANFGVLRVYCDGSNWFSF